VNGRIYLDYNASAPLLPEVQAALRDFATQDAAFNPSSIHQSGQHAKRLIEEARDRLTAALGLCCGDRVVFTSGATEANNTAAFQPFLNGSIAHARPHVVISAVEHPCLDASVARLTDFGFKVMKLAPHDLQVENLPKLTIPAETAFFSCMLANNETGMVFPVSKIAALIRVRAPHALIHCDGAQAFGKIPLNFKELGVDILSLSGHKIGAPPGVGALIVRSGVTLHPLLLGGPQEHHERAGTENVFGIHCFGIAAEVVTHNLSQRSAAFEHARTTIRDILSERVPNCCFNTPPNSLPNTLSVSLKGIPADDLVVALDMRGLAVSSGAACASGKPDPSHVLLALGLSAEEARSTIRISVPPLTDEKMIIEAAELLTSTILGMTSTPRKIQSAATGVAL
jgi:cysteine desulfurase